MQTGLPGGRKGYRETLKTRAFGETLPSCRGEYPGRDPCSLVSCPFRHGCSQTPRDLNRQVVGSHHPTLVIPLLILVLPDILLYCIVQDGFPAGCRV